MKLASIVAKYNGEMKVHIVPFTEIQLEIREKCPEEHLTLVMRRFMMQIAEKNRAEKRTARRLSRAKA
ncbi:MAG: hypothetical protein L6V93_18335 [Clostridiales bacterium]|nr:MAG: hypothetical protein L6V93_18335 [Clostridiales bacterium]